MIIDEVDAASDAAREAKIEEIIAREKAPLEEEIRSAKADAASAMTALASKTNEWSASEAEYLRRIAELTALTAPPQRESLGTPGKVTTFTTPQEFSGVEIVGPLKFQTAEFELYDFVADISEGVYTVPTNVIQVDSQAVFGRAVIANGVIRTAKPSAYIGSGITGSNLIVRDVEVSGPIDGFNLTGDALLSGVRVHDLGQYPAGTPGVTHSNGSHTDAVATGTGIRRLVVADSILDVGALTVAGSLSALMLSPGLPNVLHIIGSILAGGIPVNVGPDTAFSEVVLAGAKFGRGPVGPYPSADSPKWAGESIIAKTTPRAQITAALTAGKSTQVDGTAVVVKKG